VRYLHSDIETVERVTARTVRRDWTKARGWLHHALNGDARHDRALS